MAMISAIYKRRRELILLVLAVAGFIVVSWLSRRYAPFLLAAEPFTGWIGRLVYVGAMAAAIVVAPVETFPLLPLAVTLWGPAATFALSIAGWSIGSLAAFLLARRFGERLVYRFVDRRHVEELRGKLDGRRLFWLIAFARFVLPVDVVSYAAGMFTKMPWYEYLAATIIGIVPFALLFSYAASYSVLVQLAVGAAVLAIAALYWRRIRSGIRNAVEFVRCKTCD
jgi:uncharacterized membrane protein YdjX (TVP38/TMEM64 family)